MAESVRVAAVQDSPVLLDRDACIAQVEQLTGEAAVQGASLVVFPEAFVPGPPAWIDAVLPGEDADWHVLLQRNAVTVPGEAVDRLAAAARRAGVVLVVGVNERDANGGTIYNTVLIPARGRRPSEAVCGQGPRTVSPSASLTRSWATSWCGGRSRRARGQDDWSCDQLQAAPSSGSS